VTPSDREARRRPLTAAQIRDWCLAKGRPGKIDRRGSQEAERVSTTQDETQDEREWGTR
jgi:hypothetical protein